MDEWKINVGEDASESGKVWEMDSTLLVVECERDKNWLN